MTAVDEVVFAPSPEQAGHSQMAMFAREAGADSGLDLADYAALHRYSLDEPGAFWRRVWSFCDVRGDPGTRALVDGDRMPGARWFPDARLNFAENLLWRRDEAPALVFVGEAGARREISFASLAHRVGRAASALRATGVGSGDRVAGYLPNAPEAIIAMLASASLGAIWSSCSPDFAPQGVVDRFGQIEPTVLFCTDAYDYGGRRFDVLPKLPEILGGLPSVRRCVIVPYDGGPVPTPTGEVSAALPDPVGFDEFLAAAPAPAPSFERFPFDHPLYVLYSSGTTGKPKCIVHGAGGTLLQHLKEHRLHTDLRPEDRLFYFTTCGWMMWNWLASGLASGATLVLYDGSPFHPSPEAVFDLAQRERVTILGVSAKFLDAVSKAGVEPARSHDLTALRAILSTGSPLAPEGYDYVYRRVKGDVPLVSMSGGTDIVSCFVLGSPTLPVRRGEIQCPGLGMRVEVYDPAGRRIRGEEGELVCTAPFPSMPVRFWNDPDGARYRAAYFDRFPGVWCHGDWTRETDSGGYVISGRSDAVLNPGGVRIGTAEIYRPVEAMSEVIEAIAVGQEWEGDVRVVLFVRLREDAALDDDLRDRIRRAVREGASPRHVPARVLEVADIPRTRSGKITELAVREVIHDRDVKNVGALANPEALDLYRDRPELAT